MCRNVGLRGRRGVRGRHKDEELVRKVGRTDPLKGKGVKDGLGGKREKRKGG